MEELLNQMGKRILERRKQLRLTQEELAERAGITSQTISSAELGKKALRPANIIRICSALEISTDYLLLGTVTNEDYNKLPHKIFKLTPTQYRHLEDIINSFVTAIQEKEGKSVNTDF